MEQGMPIPVVITAYADRSLHLRDQDAAGQLLPAQAAKLPKGGGKTPGRETSRQGDHGAGARDRRGQDGRSERQRHRRRDAKIIAGSARSMGIEVVE